MQNYLNGNNIRQRLHISHTNQEQNHTGHLSDKICGMKFVLFVCLFVIVALRPMSTAMVIAGRSVHLTTLFPGQA